MIWKILSGIRTLGRFLSGDLLFEASVMVTPSFFGAMCWACIRSRAQTNVHKANDTTKERVGSSLPPRKTKQKQTRSYTKHRSATKVLFEIKYEATNIGCIVFTVPKLRYVACILRGVHVRTLNASECQTRNTNITETGKLSDIKGRRQNDTKNPRKWKIWAFLYNEARVWMPINVIVLPVRRHAFPPSSD